MKNIMVILVCCIGLSNVHLLHAKDTFMHQVNKLKQEKFAELDEKHEQLRRYYEQQRRTSPESPQDYYSNTNAPKVENSEQATTVKTANNRPTNSKKPLVERIINQGNTSSAAGGPSWVAVCTNGRRVVVYRSSSSEWASGGLGRMGSKYNNYSLNQIADHVCH